MRAQDIPAELRERSQWLLWSADSDPPKVPLNEDGYKASWTDPAEWLSFEEANELAETNDKFDGLGFVVTEKDPYIGLDLDGCLREPNAPKPKEWLPSLSQFSDTWMQYSTSGTGIHVFTRGDRLPDWWTDSHFSEGEHEGVEAYAEKFFVMTGNQIEIADDEITQVDVDPFLSDAYEAINGGPPELPGANDSADSDVDVGVYDVIARSSYPEGENAAHPFHPSETGTNFRVDDGGDTWRCWRHGVTGNGAHLLGIEQGVIECGEWDTGGLDSDTWRDIFDAGREAGYDLPEPETDGGTAAASPSPDRDFGPGQPDQAIDLNPLRVIERAGYDPDEVDLAELRNDELAYTLAEMIDKSDDVHMRWVDDNSTIFAYDDGVWSNDGEDQLREVLHRALRHRNSQRMHSEAAHAIKSRPTLKIGRDHLGAPEGTLATTNGLLDLRDRTLRDLTPEDYALNRINTDYDPTADYEGTRWMEFLEESVRDGDLKKLQEYAGYTLWHHAQPFGKALFLVGPADAGKGVFLDVIEEILGDDNVASQSLFELMQSRWGVAELFGKMANIRNEVTAGGLKNVEKFKELTGGGDRISAERKGQDPFKFKVTQKFLFSTNQVPSVEQAGEPFFNRLLFVKFPDTVPESKQDPDLSNDLLAEGPAILNWMLDGLDRLLENGQFSDERSADGKRDIADAWGNLVDRFKHNLIEVTGNQDDVVHKADLFDLFNAYGDYLGKPDDVPQSTFTKTLKSEPGISDGRSRRVDGDKDTPQVYKGIRVNAAGVEEMGADMPRHNYDDDSTSGQQRF
ncbi:Phage or plasmid associated DNA primase, primpoldomain [Halanaeroarchaeum sp. HSR-CO]|uniref:phage/plasmid primase, P4 family n=1 Tax=Halanaeroarchaeum sp. HSR-CO TaxID=2866382 RepID=UPI00217E2539|nr:phage/plasmid primase, P4 family [Halanaeroarchaeum sp. HSR-CO]UWG47896.1 Phage or plasmid associated DNA primase, primpoldomain [Halanaeroarchaeum sp. HSR-CO]